MSGTVESPDIEIGIALAVAVADNGVIGRDNALPWRMPSDLKHFRRVTIGKPVIMGRKTFESIGGPLPGRENIVVTRSPSFNARGVHIYHKLETALAAGREMARRMQADEVVVIGGTEVFAAVLEQADRIYLTEVHARPEGDVVMPELAEGDWREVSREDRAAGPNDDYDMSFVALERVRSTSGEDDPNDKNG